MATDFSTLLRQFADVLEGVLNQSNGNTAAAPAVPAQSTRAARAPERVRVELTLDVEADSAQAALRDFQEYAREQGTGTTAAALVQYLQELDPAQVRPVSWRAPAFPGYGSTDR